MIRTSTPRLIAVLLLLIGIFAMNSIGLRDTPPGINYDSAHNLAHALRISRGEHLPALIFDDRPEIAHRFLLAGWFSLVGASDFTARLLHNLIGLLSAALIYRATLEVLRDQKWRTLAGLVAMTALVAALPQFMLSRSAYRAALLAPLLALTLILLLKAMHRRNAQLWIAGGFVSGLAINVYFAGLVTPIWVGTWVIFQRVIARKLTWRESGWLLAGFALPLAVWAIIMTYVSNLFYRFNAVQADDASLPERLINGAEGVLRAFVSDAYDEQVLYNIPNVPFLNPALALLALVGLFFALRYWRRGTLLIFGVILFALPAALSEEPTHPVRLIGTLPFLAILSGWGVASLATLAEKFSPSHALKFVTVALTGLVIIFSLGSTFTRFHHFFDTQQRYDPPEDWRNVPHNYSLPLVEAMTLLAEVDQPTYVPLYSLDDRIATLILLSDAFPHVTTLPNFDGLTELPAGQVFYPAYDYLFIETPERYPVQALLLPEHDTIVILPLSAGEIIKQQTDTQTLTSEHGWTVAYITPREAAPLPEIPQPLPRAAFVGEGLRLINPHTVIQAEGGELLDIHLEWQISRSYNRDIFTFVQLLGGDQIARASSDRQILPYIYPSTRWQAGDILPDIHTLQLPLSLDEDAYRLVGGAWITPSGQNRLPVTGVNGDPLGDLLYWGALTTASPPEVATPEIELNAQFGEGFLLEGITYSVENDRLQLNLFWQMTTPQSAEYTVFIHMMDGEEIVAQTDTRPSPPTWSYSAGERFTLSHTFDLTGLTWDTIYVGMYSFPSLARLPITVDDTEIGDRLPVIEEAE